MYVQNICAIATVMFCLGASSAYADIGDMYSKMMECVEEFGVTDEKVQEVKQTGNFADIDPCFFKCFFHKIGCIDSKGMYDVDKAVEITKVHIKNPDNVVKINEIKTECARVNDEKVSDGENGCDRSLKLFECYIEHQLNTVFHEEED